MLKLLFSIPIHERLEVVIDQIVNIQTLNEDAGIVLHLSLGYCDRNSSLPLSDFLRIVKRFDNVWVNPNRVRTGNYDIIQAHMENFNYIKGVVEFEYFSMLASNELFIKRGLYNYIHNYDCGVDYNDVSKNNRWYAGKQAKSDNSLMAIMAHLDADKIVGSQIEGTFYRKELFDIIQKNIVEYYDYRTMAVAYAREEVYFSTIFWAINRNANFRVLKGGMFTFCPWSRQFTMNIRLNEVRNLMQDISNNTIYSVKRCDRKLNDCIRAYLRQYYGYVECEKILLGGAVRVMSNVGLRCAEVKKEMLCYWLIMKKVFKKIRSFSDIIKYTRQYFQI